ncbi:MAG: LytTR family transcriptional regulator DNA-binding domain-containing protein [Balneolaceae bacterium]
MNAAQSVQHNWTCNYTFMYVKSLFSLLGGGFWFGFGLMVFALFPTHGFSGEGRANDVRANEGLATVGFGVMGDRMVQERPGMPERRTQGTPGMEGTQRSPVASGLPGSSGSSGSPRVPGQTMEPDWDRLEALLQGADSDLDRMNTFYDFSFSGSGRAQPGQVLSRLQEMEVTPDAQPLKQAIMAGLMAREAAGSNTSLAMPSERRSSGDVGNERPNPPGRPSGMLSGRDLSESSLYYASKAAELYLGANEVDKYLREQIFLSLQHRRTRSFVEAEAVIADALEIAEATRIAEATKIAGGKEMEQTSVNIDSGLLAALYSNAGSIYALTLAHDLAEAMFSEAAVYSTSPEMECMNKNSAANALNQVKRASEAAERIAPCLELEVLTADFRSTLYMTLSNSMLAMGDTLQAITYVENAIQLMPGEAMERRAGRMSHLGQLLLDVGERDRAGAIAEELQQISAANFRPSVLFPVDTFLMEYFLETGNPEAALQLSDRYLARLPAATEHPLVGPVHELRSAIYSRLGESEKALESSNLHIQQMKWVGQQQDRMEEANASVRLQLRKIQADADRSALQERSANRRALLFLLLVLVVGVMSIVLLQRYRTSKMQAQSFSEKLSEAEEETERLRKLIKMRQQNRGEGAAFDDTQRIRFSKNLQISPASISHLESEGNYVRIVPVESGKPELQERMTLKYCEELLPADLFTRVHRSFIVNMTQIDRVDGELIYMKNGDDIRISRTVKNELLEL